MMLVSNQRGWWLIRHKARPLFKLSSPTLFPPPRTISSTAFPRPNLRSTHTLSAAKKPMAGWACVRCTFLNAADKSNCDMCNVHGAASTGAEWSCKRCTFFNGASNSQCDICGAVRPDSLLTQNDADYDDDELQILDTVGPVFRPLSKSVQSAEKEKEKEDDSSGFVLPRKRPVDDCDEGWISMKKSSSSSSSVSTDTKAEEKPSCPSELEPVKPVSFVFLTYNVWFENLKMHERMKALGELIEQHQPHFICLQEVTPDIYAIFQNSSWWSKYTCSVSPEMSQKRPYFCIQLSKLKVKKFSRRGFRNTIMGRELCMADVDMGIGEQIVFATTHLESPCPAPPTWNQMYSTERVCQMTESLAILNDYQNVIFGGDMNWDDGKDGAPPLPDGWYDAWSDLKSAEDGWTYDTRANQMLSANRSLRKRLDRILCSLQNFEIETIDMIGKDPIPGQTYKKEKKVKGQIQALTLPVLPSDHFGLLLKFKRKEQSGI